MAPENNPLPMHNLNEMEEHMYRAFMHGPMDPPAAPAAVSFPNTHPPLPLPLPIPSTPTREPNAGVQVQIQPSPRFPLRPISPWTSHSSQAYYAEHNGKGSGSEEDLMNVYMVHAPGADTHPPTQQLQDEWQRDQNGWFDMRDPHGLHWDESVLVGMQSQSQGGEGVGCIDPSLGMDEGVPVGMQVDQQSQLQHAVKGLEYEDCVVGGMDVDVGSGFGAGVQDVAYAGPVYRQLSEDELGVYDAQRFQQPQPHSAEDQSFDSTIIQFHPHPPPSSTSHTPLYTTSPLPPVTAYKHTGIPANAASHTTTPLVPPLSNSNSNRSHTSTPVHQYGLPHPSSSSSTSESSASVLQYPSREPVEDDQASHERFPRALEERGSERTLGGDRNDRNDRNDRRLSPYPPTSNANRARTRRSRTSTPVPRYGSPALGNGEREGCVDLRRAVMSPSLFAHPPPRSTDSLPLPSHPHTPTPTHSSTSPHPHPSAHPSSSPAATFDETALEIKDRMRAVGEVISAGHVAGAAGGTVVDGSGIVGTSITGATPDFHPPATKRVGTSRTSTPAPQPYTSPHPDHHSSVAATTSTFNKSAQEIKQRMGALGEFISARHVGTAAGRSFDGSGFVNGRSGTSTPVLRYGGSPHPDAAAAKVDRAPEDRTTAPALNGVRRSRTSTPAPRYGGSPLPDAAATTIKSTSTTGKSSTPIPATLTRSRDSRSRTSTPVPRYGTSPHADAAITPVDRAPSAAHTSNALVPPTSNGDRRSRTSTPVPRVGTSPYPDGAAATTLEHAPEDRISAAGTTTALASNGVRRSRTSTPVPRYGASLHPDSAHTSNALVPPTSNGDRRSRTSTPAPQSHTSPLPQTTTAHDGGRVEDDHDHAVGDPIASDTMTWDFSSPVDTTSAADTTHTPSAASPAAPLATTSSFGFKPRRSSAADIILANLGPPVRDATMQMEGSASVEKAAAAGGAVEASDAGDSCRATTLPPQDVLHPITSTNKATSTASSLTPNARASISPAPPRDNRRSSTPLVHSTSNRGTPSRAPSVPPASSLSNTVPSATSLTPGGRASIPRASPAPSPIPPTVPPSNPQIEVTDRVLEVLPNMLAQLESLVGAASSKRPSNTPTPTPSSFPPSNPPSSSTPHPEAPNTNTILLALIDRVTALERGVRSDKEVLDKRKEETEKMRKRVEKIEERLGRFGV